MSLPVHIESLEPITLGDGIVLDERQTRAAAMAAQGEFTLEEIAEATGYSSASNVSRFLTSTRGREAVEVAVRQLFLADAVLGLNTLRKLAKSAKSELVRLQAADRLVERGLGPVPQGQQQASTPSSVSISINLGGHEPSGITIEHEGDGS